LIILWLLVEVAAGLMLVEVEELEDSVLVLH
jgi:hypothetical protein